MASPLTIKAKWPSQKQASAGDMAADFVPYVSNLVNTFRKVPRPRAPKLIDPVTGTRISLSDARRQVSDQTQAADLSTQNLDAQTGAAIRVGNMGNKLRAFSDINAKEAMANAQISNQTRYINANIDAQNASITNAYRDDLTNADIAQQRVQADNLANAADKFINQQAVKDQMKLDREKTTIMSKMYNPGVYNRFMGSLQQSGIDTDKYGVPPVYDEFAKYKNMKLPAAKPQLDLNTSLPPETLKSMKKYMSLRNTYAAGGMMGVYTGDPGTPPAKRDAYYESSATLAYYKDKLNEKLKAKNPTGFTDYFKGLVDLRRSGNQQGATDYVKNAKYNDYLSPEEVRTTLGDTDYQKYLNSIQTVNQYNVQQGMQPLYGNIEGENDITKLNYGRRFASLQITPSVSVTNTTRNTRYDRRYVYDPTAGKVNYTEEGDKSLKPNFLERATGGQMKRKYTHGGKMKPFC